MSKHYKHITDKERDWIGRLLSEGQSIRTIASSLHRNPSSIARELQRNRGNLFGCDGYYPIVAKRISTKRKVVTHRRPRIKDTVLRSYIESKLKKLWSPELIVGRLSIDMPGHKVSHEAIYQWIYAERHDLIGYLARKRTKRRHRGYSKKLQKQRIPCRVSISERPPHVQQRQEVGHWEVDTVGVDSYGATLQVLTERKTRYTRIRKLPVAHAEIMKKELVKGFRNTPQKLVKTFTYDNGPENWGHVYVNYKLGTKSYFCHPYHSWERGTVENTIGIIRRRYPKGTDFANVSESQVEQLQKWLNKRPKKCLGFRTPWEAYSQERSVALTR